MTRGTTSIIALASPEKQLEVIDDAISDVISNLIENADPTEYVAIIQEMIAVADGDGGASGGSGPLLLDYVSATEVTADYHSVSMNDNAIYIPDSVNHPTITVFIADPFQEYKTLDIFCNTTHSIDLTAETALFDGDTAPGAVHTVSGSRRYRLLGILGVISIQVL